MPYALLIGETNSEFIPERVSVLSYCDDRILNISKTNEKPNEYNNYESNIFHKRHDNLWKKRKWIISSENKAIWGNPEILKGCKLRNGKYRIEYDKQFSNSPKIEFIVDNGT